MDFSGILGNISFFLNTSLPSVVGGQTGTADAVTEAAQDTAASPFSWLTTILLWGGVIVVGYFFMYRQPRKEMKKKQELRNAIKVGDSVMTNAGLYGKVVEIGADVFILEFGTNKGVRVPVAKEAVEAKREPNYGVAVKENGEEAK